MKLNYIEWYLVELRRLIGDSVPLEKQNSLLHESKNHLKAKAIKPQRARAAFAAFHGGIVLHLGRGRWVAKRIRYE